MQDDDPELTAAEARAAYWRSTLKAAGWLPAGRYAGRPLLINEQGRTLLLDEWGAPPVMVGDFDAEGFARNLGQQQMEAQERMVASPGAAMAATIARGLGDGEPISASHWGMWER